MSYIGKPNFDKFPTLIDVNYNNHLRTNESVPGKLCCFFLFKMYYSGTWIKTFFINTNVCTIHYFRTVQTFYQMIIQKALFKYNLNMNAMSSSIESIFHSIGFYKFTFHLLLTFVYNLFKFCSQFNSLKY